MKYDVFISYSRKDSDIVKNIVKTLEDMKLKIWFDQTGIESGEEFINKIVRAIDNSDSVLFMYSDHAIEGEWTQKEVTYAKKQGKVVRPILVYGSMPMKGWFTFLYGNVDCIDYTDKKQVEKLLSNLRDTYLKQEPTEIYQHHTLHDDLNESKNLQDLTNKPQEELHNKSTSTDSFEFYISNGKAGFRDKETHKTLIPFSYEDAFIAGEDRIAVRNNGQWGFVDLHGDPICPIKYTEVNEFHDGMALVKYGDHYGYLNTEGGEVIPCIYSIAYPFSCERAVVEKYNGQTAVINKQGKSVLHFKKNRVIRSYKDNYCVVDNKYIYNKDGQSCFIEYPFESVYDFSEGYAWVSIKGRFKILSAVDGSLVCPRIKITDVDNFHEGLSIFHGDKGMGVINTKGDVIIVDSLFKEIGSFSEGLAQVCNFEGNYGYIDMNGTLVIPTIYGYASQFINGISIIGSATEVIYGCINKSGKIIVPIKYSHVSFSSENLIIACIDKKIFGRFH